MGMSSYIQGLRSPDGEWKKKRAAVKALVEAGENVPDSLLRYFGDIEAEYVLKDDTAGLEVKVPSKKGTDDSSEWIEVAVKDIPAGVERIRFINSW